MVNTEERQMIKDCWTRKHKLNDWELGYIEMFIKWIDDHRFSLSDKQIDVLNKIWDRVT
jgi:hypothetical protein